MTVPVNWNVTGHTGHPPPYCGAFIQVRGDQFVPALNKGKSVFNCFGSIDAKGPATLLPSRTPNATRG